MNEKGGAKLRRLLLDLIMAQNKVNHINSLADKYERELRDLDVYQDVGDGRLKLIMARDGIVAQIFTFVEELVEGVKQ